MFFHVLRVNSALVRLGADPNAINQTFKVGVMAAGKSANNSPEEIAVFIASQLPLALQMTLNPAVVKAWIRKRKLNPRDPEISDALERLGWGLLADY